MSSVAIRGNAAGTGVFTIASPSSANSHILTLPAATGTLSLGAQIQPISASVSSSTMIVSAGHLTLDFRSPTYGDGTVTTVSGTPANLVIPSGATLGTVSAQTSRLLVIALNNSGTIELGVANMNMSIRTLDESNTISTIAITAASDSTGSVYSTTARSDVAYRVIGYIESTQATSGTWAAAPDIVQGAGGQVFGAMVSLGYGQKITSVTRTSGTTYFNTTGRPIVFYCRVTVSSTFEMSIAGVSMGSLSTGTSPAMNVNYVIAPGQTYVATGGFDLARELR